MADQDQRTEKPSKRKLQKSRREGQFAASRELVAALQFVTFVILVSAGGGSFFERMREMVRFLLRAAFSMTLTPRSVLRIYGALLGLVFSPLLWMGATLTAGEHAPGPGARQSGAGSQAPQPG